MVDEFDEVVDFVDVDEDEEAELEVEEDEVEELDTEVDSGGTFTPASAGAT